MCGILCLLRRAVIEEDILRHCGLASGTCREDINTPYEARIEDLYEALRRRGPDLLSQIHEVVDGDGIDVHMAGSLLQLRGKKRCPAVYTDDKEKNILLFNGEVYAGLDIEEDENDAQTIFCALQTANHAADIVNLFRSINGPWSFIYWRRENKELWFGRDAFGVLLDCAISAHANRSSVWLGRRSLLFHYDPRIGQCILSSTVASKGVGSWLHSTEVPPAIYRLTVSTVERKAHMRIEHQWINFIAERSLSFSSMAAATEAFLEQLRHSIKIRYRLADTRVDDPVAPVLILFSGGVDSTLLAALLHEVMPSHLAIDLCNVSFNNNSAPDRANSISALEVLMHWAPEREWRLICVDSDLKDMENAKDWVLRLISPCNTIMDLNIGTALWLAATANGYLYPSGMTYMSQARTVFIGHGADEQCAGYARHRTKYRESGWPGVENELTLEMSRLWTRNLGRDDRLISDHGREARLPFLDEHVVSFLKEIPLRFLFDPTQPRGVGEKLLLREALKHLGLSSISTREKRAIQFGSHISKLTNRERFGSNRAANKQQAGTQRLDLDKP